MYHVAHYCKNCRELLDHSQGTFNELRQWNNRHKGHEFVDVPTKKLSKDSKKLKRQFYVFDKLQTNWIN